jgi:hypothetical protein
MAKRLRVGEADAAGPPDWTDQEIDDFVAAHRAVIEGDLGGYREAVRAGLANIGAGRASRPVSEDRT